MNTACRLHLFLPILTVLLSSPAAAGQLTPSPSPPSPGGCADSVISFSPCLPYISAPPNNLSSSPSSQCCEIFIGAFDSDDAECLCYLVRHNSLLGFPLNVTKLLSLSDLCSVKNDNQTNDTSDSLDSICSGSPTLPPLMATPRNPPSGSNARRPPPPPRPTTLHPPPSTITKPSPADNESTQNATKPSTSDHGNDPNDTFLWALVFALVYFVILSSLNMI